MTEHRRKTIRLDPCVYREPGRVFSVTIGTSPRSDVFGDVEFGRACVDLLRTLSVERGNRVFAYCLMPDHVHLLVGTGPRAPLPDFVAAWKSGCYRERRRRGDASPFWQRSFLDHALREAEDLRTAALYILGNPVRRGLVDDFHDYPLCGSFEFEV